MYLVTVIISILNGLLYLQSCLQHKVVSVHSVLLSICDVRIVAKWYVVWIDDGTIGQGEDEFLYAVNSNLLLISNHVTVFNSLAAVFNTELLSAFIMCQNTVFIALIVVFDIAASLQLACMALQSLRQLPTFHDWKSDAGFLIYEVQSAYPNDSQAFC